MRLWPPPGSVVLALVLLVGGAAPAGAVPPIPAVPIPQNPSDVAAVPAFVGQPAEPRPIQSFAVPRHPFMAPNGRSNVHDDGYQTDHYRSPGPLGRDVQVSSTFQAAVCGTVTFDAAGRIVTTCVGLQGPRLMLFDPITLATLATMPLPPRMGPGGGGGVFGDFTGGGYFYLDDQDRAVIPTTNRQIWVVAETSGPLGPGFVVQRMYDLASAIPLGAGIVSALPDWSGRIWFVTADGIVGTVDPASGAVAALTLDGEVIANSFAVDETGGVFIVSDHALYRFDADPATGAPQITWREPYDRGSTQKPGQVSQGSGTTPTLIGRRWVAITDNADPRMQVVVYRRAAQVSGHRFVCSEPVFTDGASDTENSLITVGRSLIVENNYGYTGPAATELGATTEPGVARVLVRRREGRIGCETAWTISERVPSVVSKVSLANGLLYLYTKDPGPGSVDAWYLTAVDVRSGATIYRRLAGTGLGFNNNYAPVTLGPDGSAYVGALGGLVRLADA